MELQNRKIVILGAGHVGSHAGYSLIAQGLAEEIVYIDIDQRKAEAQALDLFDATNYLPSRAKVRAGTYTDATDAALCRICPRGKPAWTPCTRPFPSSRTWWSPSVPPAFRASS